MVVRWMEGAGTPDGVRECFGCGLFGGYSFDFFFGRRSVRYLPGGMPIFGSARFDGCPAIPDLSEATTLRV